MILAKVRFCILLHENVNSERGKRQKSMISDQFLSFPNF